jgi:hypothetical protein
MMTPFIKKERAQSTHDGAKVEDFIADMGHGACGWCIISVAAPAAALVIDFVLDGSEGDSTGGREILY